MRDGSAGVSLEYEFLATLTLSLGESHPLGDLPSGWHRFDVIAGGTLTGPEVSGTVISGGSDILHRRSDSTLSPHVRLVVRTGDGALILVTYEGIRWASPEADQRLAAGEALPYTDYYLRTMPRFETSAERYSWLNRTLSVGIGRRAGQQVVYEIFRIL